MVNAAWIGDLKDSLMFINLIQNAALNDQYSGLDEEAIHRLRHPMQHVPVIDDHDIHLSLKLLLATDNASEETYVKVHEVFLQEFPDREILSQYLAKRHLEDLSGVTSIVHDMCPSTCVAYVGPYSDHDHCPMCSEPWYDQAKLEASGGKIKSTCRQFHTIPISHTIQALWQDPESAKQMKYCNECTHEVIAELNANRGEVDMYDDFFQGSDYLEAVHEGKIKAGDRVLMLSLDGAQLYHNKQLDCWMYIWVIYELSPDRRYKKKHVIPGVVIPGPNKPKNLKSFLFPKLHHLSAVQNEGLYHGGYSCCRHKPNNPHYYPVLLRPHHYNVAGCTHEDINVFPLPSKQGDYDQKLRELLKSHTQAQYNANRLQTGIAWPSIILGLKQARILGVPRCFGSDIMHIAAINLPDLLPPLWQGITRCDPTDDKRTWDWMVLTGAVWVAHRKAVGDVLQYLPGSFGRPPCNPAEKINTGYKAWEYLLYIFGLCPALLYGILPEQYWRHFCRLLQLLIWENEFELLYYQRRVDRLHFVCPVVHSWTMERTIGNLGQEIWQPSNPYTNLSARAVHRAQVNALKGMIPDLEPEWDPIPRGAKALGDGFILLRATERTASEVAPSELPAFQSYMTQISARGAPPKIYRWARLRLPNEQVARSAWKENLKPLDLFDDPTKIHLENATHFTEVHFYTQMKLNDDIKTVALVSFFSQPDPHLLHLSWHTFLSCVHSGHNALCVIEVKSIVSVVAMILHKTPGDNRLRHFVVEKPGLDVATIGGWEEDTDEEWGTLISWQHW
ncbi:hypothetical protein BDN67DRAFT_991965 [Paxillus ammoniavirescens]|nr:hypothetical protein BDN67DRAFT_991965 [Paxillus ammoniavirescens]